VKKSYLAIGFCAAAFSVSVSAAGWVDSASLTYYSGWACDSADPNYQGWIHVWRDDNLFLAGIPANIPREPAVASLCGGSGVHGFGSIISLPDSYLDNKVHKVRFYFIKRDGSNFEVPGSPVSVVFGNGQIKPPEPPAPPPPAISPTVVSGCDINSRPDSTWMMTGVVGLCVNGWYSWTSTANLPIGYRLNSCSQYLVPAGWVKVGWEGNSSICQRQDGWRAWKNDQHWIYEKRS